MTTPARDRAAALATIGVLAVLGVVAGALVLDAQRAGIRTSEELRLEQVDQLAGSMDARVQQAFGVLGARVGGPGTWRLVPGDPADTARLQPTDPRATSGSLLLDRDGRIVNGSLLRDPGSVGDRYRREGLGLVLGGEPTVLGIGPGLTTTEPVLGIGIPVRDAVGRLAGAYVIEVEVAADSPFSEEVAQLDPGDAGSFSFVDSDGRVAASSDERLLARRLPVDERVLRPGFRRHDGDVFAVDEVPSARWRLVFRQSVDDFEGDVTGPTRGALLVLLALVVLAGTLGVASLVRRLRAAREEHRRLTEVATAREEFTSIVSHELRTPVAGLLGFLQTTIDHWQEMSDEERRRAVSRAHQSAQRLQGLTTEVLDATTGEAGGLDLRIELVDLGAVVGEAVDTARLAHPGRPFTVETPAAGVTVEIDPGRIRQVVTNLLDNAVRNSPADAPIDVRVSVDGDLTRVAVRDHGAGIQAGDRERIFERFTRVPGTAGRGASLGLYLAREIVRAHGGSIGVVDAPGPGATVAFTLPAGPDHAGG